MGLLRALSLLLFGLMFAGGGVFFLSQTLWPTWTNWRGMQRWQPAQAQLIEITGGESETIARYRYQWNGDDFEGERVHVATFNDNIGSYHEELQQRLRTIKRGNQPFPIWVNPDDPSQAVIDRDMRWGLFAFMAGFCSIFILIGGFVMRASLRAPKELESGERPSLMAMRREWKEAHGDPDFKQGFLEFSRDRIIARQQNIQRQDTDLPPVWQERKEWRSSEIRSNAMGGMALFWIMALAFSAASAPALFAMPKELNQGNYAMLLALLFPLAALFLLYSAITRTLEFLRFGKVIYRMEPYPGAIGGQVGGRILLPRLGASSGLANTPGMPGGSPWKVRLECIYSYVSGSGDNRSRHEDLRWAEEGTPGVEQTPVGTGLSFRFDIPADLPEADVEQNGNYIFWRLSIKGDIPGVDLDRQYNIPVFRGDTRSNPAYSDISEQDAQRKARESEAIRQSIQLGDFEHAGLTGSMHIENLGDTIRLYFPMFRNRIVTLLAAIFAAGFGFASFLIIGTALDGGLFGIIAGLFSIPFVLVALFAAIATLYLPFNSLRVLIGRREISVLRSLLLIPVYRKRLPARELTGLSIKKSGSTGQGAKQIVQFKVLAHYGQGRTLTLAEDLEGEDAAGHFRDYLARHLGME